MVGRDRSAEEDARLEVAQRRSHGGGAEDATGSGEELVPKKIQQPAGVELEEKCPDIAGCLALTNLYDLGICRGGR